MSHGVPYFIWRDGRPRWSPGPEIRSLGFKTRDLRRDDGSFMDLDEALAKAIELNAETGRVTKVALPKVHRVFEPNRLNRKGYIYFLWVGNSVKIGFSTNPLSRLSALGVSIPDEPAFFSFVPGTKDGERDLHNSLADHRKRGEWFRASFTVRRAIQRMMNKVLDPTVRACEETAQSHVSSPVREAFQADIDAAQQKQEDSAGAPGRD